MKKIVFIISLVLLLTSCSSTSDSGETEALKKELEQIKTSMKENFETESVDDLVTMFNEKNEELTQLMAESEEKQKELQDKIDAMTLELKSASGQSLICAALDVAELLKSNDYETLSSQYIDSTEGLRFSPLPYIDLTSDQHFTAAEVANLGSDPTVYTWTTSTPSGDPLAETYADYATQYVNDHDYTQAHIIGNSYTIGTGNMINNIAAAYPSLPFVELHFTGFDPAYGGMDWASLRLVFKEIGGEWKLININHAHWTP